MMSKVRDSSLDYRTYWLQGGQHYSRRGLGSADEVRALPADKLAQFSADEQKAILAEAAANPGLAQKLYSIMTSNPNWKKVIEASMRSSVANALDPSKGQAGPWRKLQEAARTMVEAGFEEADRKVATMTLGQKVQFALDIVRGSGKSLSGLGIVGLGDLFGDLFTGIGNYFSSKVLASAQKNIASTQANAAIQVANTQVSIANAQAAIVAAQERMSSPIAALTQTTIAGIPILVPILGIVGLGLWFAFGRKR